MKDKKITRTITVTQCGYIGVNIRTREKVEGTITLFGRYANRLQALNEIKKQYFGSIVISAITTMNTEVTTYSMPYSDFIKYARVEKSHEHVAKEAH